jgi:transposase
MPKQRQCQGRTRSGRPHARPAPERGADPTRANVGASIKRSIMRTKNELLELREQAVALRRAGKSRREIKEILGVGNSTLDPALRGEPAPLWTLRPRAKDELRMKARELRANGCTYDQIAAELGVSKGSVSLWARDMPRRGRLSYEEFRKRNAEGVARYWAAERPVREARLQAISDSAAAQIGELSEREILIAGAIAYWCSPVPADRWLGIRGYEPGRRRDAAKLMSDLLPREDLNLNCPDQNRMSCQVRRRGTVEGKASLRDWRICSRRASRCAPGHADGHIQRRVRGRAVVRDSQDAGGRRPRVWHDREKATQRVRSATQAA